MKFFYHVAMTMVVIVMCCAGCSKDSNKTVEELNKQAMQLLQSDQADKALETVTDALEKTEKEYGAEHQETAMCLETMGIVYQAMKEPLKAESAYKRALSIIYKIKGEDSIESAKILNNLAGLFYSQKQYSSAASIFKKSLAIGEKKFSSDDPRLAMLQKNIKICEDLQNGKEPSPSSEQVAGKSDSQNKIQDLVPDQVKQSMLSQLAKQNIFITDLQPRNPVKIDNKGIVFPYHALKKSKDSDSAQEVVVLFASIANPEKQGAFLFQKCRLISFRSYLSTMKEGGVAQLKKELIEVFPGLYS